MVDATTSDLRELKASVRAGEEIADSVLDLVGNTPLVRLHRVVPDGSAEVLAKLDSLNPAGSVKGSPWGVRLFASRPSSSSMSR